MTFQTEIDAALAKPMPPEIEAQYTELVSHNRDCDIIVALLLRIRDLEAQVQSHVRILEMASEDVCDGIHPDSYGEDICVRNPKKKVENYCASCLAKLAKQNDWKPINLPQT